MRHLSTKLLIIFFAGMAFVMSCDMARGQEATGRIIGNVTDQSGAPIQGAKVTVKNVATQIARGDEHGQRRVLRSAVPAHRLL